MNDGLIRLSQLVPEHASYHGFDSQTAAHDLQELLEALRTNYFVSSGGSVPEHICWVGGATSSRRSSKHYMIDFESLSNYFETWAHPSPAGEPSFQCFCKTENEYRAIPAGSIYFSRNAMAEWILAAAVECPGFLISEESEQNTRTAAEIEDFKGKELASIRGLTRGLIEIIVELDRAHRGLSKKTDPAAILRAASELNLNKKTSTWRTALLDLAKAVELEEFRRSRQTLDKYIGRT